MDEGVTLMETIIVGGLFAVLTAVLVSFFTVYMNSLPRQGTRVGLQLDVDRAVDSMVRDIQGTNDVSCPDPEKDEIRFGDPNSNLYFIYYLHYKDVSDSYQLKRTSLNNDSNDIALKSFDDESGDFIAANIIPPDLSDPDNSNTSEFEVESVGAKDVVAIRLVIQKDDEILKIYTKAYPRNQ